MCLMILIMPKSIVKIPLILDRYAISGLKTRKDFLVHDEESKAQITEYDNMKKQYYKAKYHAKREEFIKK